MRERIWQPLALTLATGLTGQALANGLALNEQSASSMAMAFAGRASAAQDATTVLGNPAGMSRLARPEISGGVAWITVRNEIEHARTDTPGISGSSRGDMVPDSVVPFLFTTTPLNEHWHAGLGLYVPFALLDDYESRFLGRYWAQRSSLSVLTLQPTLSYRLNERLAIGFGPTLNRIEGELSNNLYFGQDALFQVEGDDVGYGYVVGLLAQLSPSLSGGLTYRSRVDYRLEGQARLSNVPALLPGLDALNGRYPTGMDFTTPESAELATSWRADERWTLHASATWTRWSRLEKLVVENRNVPLASFSTVEESADWHNTWAFSVGASYQLDRHWLLRSGVGIDASPASDRVRTSRIPVGDRYLLGLGAAYSPHPAMTLDLAYLYAHEKKAEVNQIAQVIPTPDGPLPIQPGFYADYRNRFHVVATQLTWRF